MVVTQFIARSTRMLMFVATGRPVKYMFPSSQRPCD